MALREKRSCCLAPNGAMGGVVMHLSSAFPGWGTPGIPGGIATFYIKVTQFSEPSGMI